MPESMWDVPRTEEGMQQVLRNLEVVRAQGNQRELGNGLLALAYLVKWVRSDTASPPFVRAHELANQALAAFRAAKDVRGQIRALIQASAMMPPDVLATMLAEAEQLAATTGDEDIQASVLAARARAMAMADRDKAEELNVQVCEIYRRTGNKAGLARCLFSRSVGSATPAEKQAIALEAADLYRSLNNLDDASRCLSIALMNAEEIEPLANLEPIALDGLRCAQEAGDRGQEKHFYQKLALIAVAKNNIEDAERNRRWAFEIESADGLTPRERWESDVAMTKTLILMAKTQGNKESVQAFQAELKRLSSAKPKRTRE